MALAAFAKHWARRRLVWLNEDWDVPSFAAARVKLCSSACRNATDRAMCVARRSQSRRPSIRPTPSSGCRQPAYAALTYGPSAAW